MKRMKELMWKVDPTGTYEFSDNTNPNQLLLFSKPEYTILQLMLSNQFKGQTVSVEVVEEYVIAETPSTSSRQKLSSLWKQLSRLL